MAHRISFFLILVFTWPLRWLSYRSIHRLGALLGSIAFALLPKFRKRAQSNLALASTLQLDEEKIRRYAKASIQNLVTTCLEYAKFASVKTIDGAISCVNPEAAAQLMAKGKPVIFFCGHQSNWEVLFLEGTTRMSGVAIGRPIKNKPMYDWVLGIREKFGGKMIAPQNAIREGLRGLKKGAFLGIVGDQGMPDSGYASPFFGRKAWSSPMPAILSHRTGSPIIVATTQRRDGKYWIHYSDPIWPDSEAPAEGEVDRLMRASLSALEEKIAQDPGQWLWSHNRWKQQTPERLKRAFRHESILIVLPEEKQELDALLPHLKTFREIYPREFITLYAPKDSAGDVSLEEGEIVPYSRKEELFKRDYRFKLVFNFSNVSSLKRHFLKLSAFQVVSLHDLRGEDLSEALKRTTLRTYAP
jgi:KDO2-lipid IV(A) lauroyltransferase